MAAIASFSVTHENGPALGNGQYRQTRRPRKPIYTRFQGKSEKKNSQKKI